MRTAREVRVTGSVQGVGFRWMTKRTADMFGIHGWVRNDPDGGVTLRIEGEDAMLDLMLERLNQSMGRHIETLTSVDAASDAQCGGFAIVR